MNKICEWYKCKKEFTPNKNFQRFCCVNCKTANSVLSKRQRTKQRALDYAGSKCSRCGYDKCSRALSFHHLDTDTKETTIAIMIGNNVKWEIIQKELDKCVVLCGNCHMELHDEEVKARK